MDLLISNLKETVRMFPGAAAAYRINGDALETLYYSPQMAAILEMGPEEYEAATKHNAMDIIFPADRMKVLNEVRRCVSGKIREINIHYRVIRKSTRYDWVHLNARIIGSMEGCPILFASFADSTAESDFYQNILNHTSTMVYVCDRENYEILYANAAAEQYRQQLGQPLLGMPCYAYIQNRKTPCEDCFMRKAKAGGSLSLTRYNSEKGIWEYLRGEFIDWCGHKAFVQYIEDITKSEALHRELEKTGKRLEMVMDASDLSAWEYDIKAHTIRFTNAVFKRYGLPPVIENVPQSLLPFIALKDRQKLLDLYRRLENGESPLSGDFQFINSRDGYGSYLHTVYIITQDTDGNPVIYGASTDITTQIREREFYHNNVKALLDANPESLCAFQLNLSRNQCNEVHGSSDFIIRTLRANTADEVFQNILGIMPYEADRNAFASKLNRKALVRQFELGNFLDHLDYRRYNEAEKIIWVRTYINLLKNPDTNDITVIIYSVDINDQKETDHIFKIMTGREYQLVSIVDIESRSVYAKFIGEKLPDAYRFFYHTEGDSCTVESLRKFIMKNWLMTEDIPIYMAGTDLQTVTQKMSAGGQFEFTVRAHSSGNGNQITYHRFQHYWLDETHLKILVVMSDVTNSVLHQQAELEKERELRKQANAANVAKTEFLSRMSHDMRTPLNVILGLIHLSMERQHSKETTDELSKIDYVSKFLLGLINEMLDISAMESGHMVLHPEPYVIDDFRSYLESLARPLCEENGLKLVLDINPVAEYVPLMDQLRSNQILFNLLSNSAKFTPEGGTVTIRLYEHMTAGGRLAIKAAIEDNGIGMSEEFQSHMFEPFVQEDRNDVSLSRGSGLGLAIVKQIVDLMGAKIEVGSSLGKGTVITMTGEFDCIPAETLSSGKERHAAGDYTVLKGRHILLCEDHPLNQEIERAMLEEKGIVVDLAENGEIGVQKFCRSFPGFYDVILMDIRMPVLNGLEATKQIRSALRPDAKTIPIIAMSADVYTNDMENCIRIGMSGYIAKPIDPEKMYATIASHLNLF